MLNVMAMENPFYDKYLPTEVSNSGSLPHLNQDGKIQFVTCRLADSLPQEVINDLKKEKQQFINTHREAWVEGESILFTREFTAKEFKLMDNGFGECLLRKKEVREIIADSFHYFDGIRYDLIAYVIMPNHFHVLFRLYEGRKIEEVMHSLKGFTAVKINKLLGRIGPLWQKEYFDRIIRNKRHLDETIAYILKNPGNLPSTAFSYYVAPNY